MSSVVVCCRLLLSSLALCSQRARIHHGYQLIGHLGIALFRRQLVQGWRAEVDSRKMSANLLADLDFEDEVFGTGEESLLTGSGNGGGSSGSSAKKKKKKKKKNKDDAKDRKEKEERLREEERALAAEELERRQKAQKDELLKNEQMARKEEERRLERQQLEQQQVELRARLQAEAQHRQVGVFVFGFVWVGLILLTTRMCPLPLLLFDVQSMCSVVVIFYHEDVSSTTTVVRCTVRVTTRTFSSTTTVVRCTVHVY